MKLGSDKNSTEISKLDHENIAEILYGYQVVELKCHSPPSDKPKDPRPFIKCNKQHDLALVDSGAAVTVVPYDPKRHKTINPRIRLKAANGNPIQAYGYHPCTFRFGSRTFKWQVIAARVKNAIIGSDFLKFHGIDISFQQEVLHDGKGWKVPFAHIESKTAALQAIDQGIHWADEKAAECAHRAGAIKNESQNPVESALDAQRPDIQASKFSSETANPPPLEAFTDGKKSTAKSKSEIESGWHPRLRDFIHQNYPTTLQFDFSKKPKHGVEHEVVLKKDAKPCRLKHTRPLNAEKEEAGKKCIEELRGAKIMEPSSSNWSSALHMVRKPGGGWRTTTDCKDLNSQTVRDDYPVRHIATFQNRLRGRKMFSVIDLKKGYHQVPIKKEHRKYTATKTPWGMFQYRQMTMGLMNAAATFQRLMDEVTKDLPFVFTYLDDMLVASKDIEEHEEHLHALFAKLEEFGLAVSHDKCVLGQEELVFLGYTVNSRGIKPLRDRVEAIMDFP